MAVSRLSDETAEVADRVGTCVGARNYRYFYLFVSCTTLLSVWVLAFCIVHLIVLSIQLGAAGTTTTTPFFQAIADAPSAYVPC